MPAALSPEAEKLKAEGNKAFGEGRYRDAAALYSNAMRHAPGTAVLFASRSLAYIKQIQDPSKTPSFEDRGLLRQFALQDAFHATQFDPMYAKGHLRLADCMEMAIDDEMATQISEASMEEGRAKIYKGVISSLKSALKASDGNTREEIAKRLAEWIENGKQ